jgi:hypothetical protein
VIFTPTTILENIPTLVDASAAVGGPTLLRFEEKYATPTRSVVIDART